MTTTSIRPPPHDTSDQSLPPNAGHFKKYKHRIKSSRRFNCLKVSVGVMEKNYYEDSVDLEEEASSKLVWEVSMCLLLSG